MFNICWPKPFAFQAFAMDFGSVLILRYGKNRFFLTFSMSHHLKNSWLSHPRRRFKKWRKLERQKRGAKTEICWQLCRANQRAPCGAAAVFFPNKLQLYKTDWNHLSSTFLGFPFARSFWRQKTLHQGAKPLQVRLAPNNFTAQGSVWCLWQR